MKITFFTGAGISAESGLHTYRDKGGIWEQYDPQKVASIDTMEANYPLFVEFYNVVRKAVSEAEPNEAHYLIADLEKEHEVVVITQNIDDLHERAGSTDVYHLHGEIATKRKIYDNEILPFDEDLRVEDKERPNVVLFGEMPQYLVQAQAEIDSSDYLVVVGTSLQVYPAADLVVNKRGWWVDPEATFKHKLLPVKNTAARGIKNVLEVIKKIEYEL